MSAFVSTPLKGVQTSHQSSLHIFTKTQMPHVPTGLNVIPSVSIADIDGVVESTSTSFEPILPDTSTLIGFGFVIILSIIAANVWANQVVPVSRQKLAISKRNGEVKEYLDGLKEASVTDSNDESASSLNVRPNVGDGRDIERWLFSDWLNKSKQPKDPAIPFVLKKAKWNSGDNPVLVASAFIFAGVLAGSISDRLGSL